MTFINIPNSFRTWKHTGSFDMEETTLTSEAERSQVMQRSCSKKQALKCPQILDNLNAAGDWRLSYLNQICHIKHYIIRQWRKWWGKKPPSNVTGDEKRFDPFCPRPSSPTNKQSGSFTQHFPAPRRAGWVSYTVPREAISEIQSCCLLTHHQH